MSHAGCATCRAASHLPIAKQRQLCAITGIIRAAADVEHVLLYGSHARGDWVEDPATRYMSDLDILVLVADAALATDEALWADCQEQARDVTGAGDTALWACHCDDHAGDAGDALWSRSDNRARHVTAETPVSLIVHALEELHEQLARGNSFFRDVIAEGIVLYSAGRIALPEVQPLTPAQRYELAQEVLEHAFPHAAELHASFEHSLARGSHAIAAFLLHQAAEVLLKAVLVVFTGYRPKTHDLGELERRCARACPGLVPLVPRDAPRLANLLRAAYIDARYSTGFEVSRADLEALEGYVRVFMVRAERSCRERIAELAAGALGPGSPILDTR